MYEYLPTAKAIVEVCENRHHRQSTARITQRILRTALLLLQICFHDSNSKPYLSSFQLCPPSACILRREFEASSVRFFYSFPQAMISFGVDLCRSCFMIHSSALCHKYEYIPVSRLHILATRNGRRALILEDLNARHPPSQSSISKLQSKVDAIVVYI